MLTEKQYHEIKDELDNCKNPLFFYDDDPDGLSAYLLLYRYIREGHGIVNKQHPMLNAVQIPKIMEYEADKVFVLDVAKLEQDFIDESPVPVIWIDHHGPFERNGVKYFNPRIKTPDVNSPTTYLCYNVVKQDLWIAMVGCIADYVVPDFADQFKKEFPDIADDATTIDEYYFESKLKILIQLFSFLLKGKTGDVKKNVKLLTSINTPYELLNQETDAAKNVYAYYEKMKHQYDRLLQSALAVPSDHPILLFVYDADRTSFTGELANELQYRYPDKMILIGRKKGEYLRLSIRSREIVIPPILERALAGLDGSGGGHEHACGANVHENDLNEFVKRLKEQL